MDDHYHTLSLRLYEILDWIGASEEIRGKHREQSIVFEIVSTMASNVFDDKPYVATYILGSRCEGTTTLGLHSDEDHLVSSFYPVVEIISDAPQHGLAFLMVTDKTTKPGYCKLQAVLNKDLINHIDTSIVEILVHDQYGRPCLQHMHRLTGENLEINGPAVTRIGAIVDTDLVVALTCHHIPSFAKSWVSRVTRCDRLNETQTNILTEFGCFLVGKKHPSSQNDRIEWRLSFSLQERELMSSLNPTQHKCYILLKMIKKDIIQRHVPNSISSYHCKTCILYAIEKTPFEFWTRRNLLECTLLCIKLLLHWVNEQNCPNYFIPNENMFDRIKHRTLRQVQFVLEEMVTHWCRFIWSITCDDIGTVMSKVLFGCGPSVMRIKHNRVSEKALYIFLSINESIRTRTLLILRKCNSIAGSDFFVKLFSMQKHCLHTDCVSNHTVKETRQAIRYFIPHLRLQIAQCIASIMLSTIDTHWLRLLFGWFKFYKEESKNCDTISGYLIVASYCLQRDRYDICERILLQCETSLKSHIISVCGCYKNRTLYRNEAFNELVLMHGSQDIPYTEFARTCTTGCLVFLPYQANLVHPALHNEMYRSVYTPPDSRNDEWDFWFDWMVIDSKIYLYFMKYILYSKTNKPVYTQDAVDNLLHVVTTDPHLGHEETAWNLLGWIFKQENEIQRAMDCFQKSWKVRPIHNAAKWHVLELIRLSTVLIKTDICCKSVSK